MNIIQSLASLGLSDKQAKLYTHLLKHPKKAETVFSIAQKIDMPRSTVYVTLQELETKSLVSSFKKNNVLHYLTADPSRLARDLEEKKEVLNFLLPALHNLAKETAFSPSVQTFTGAPGVKIVFDDIFNNPIQNGVKEFHTLSHPRLVEHMPKQFPKYMENKRKLNLTTKMLVPAFVAKTGPAEYNSNSHRITRYLPPESSFEGTLIIYGRKTALFSHKGNEVYSMIVDSPAITEMLDAIFMCLWNLLPAGSTK